MPANDTSASNGKKPSYKSRKKNDSLENFGHLQPQAVELEQAVLGALMIERDAYYQVSEILRPESFYDNLQQCGHPLHRRRI